MAHVDAAERLRLRVQQWLGEKGHGSQKALALKLKKDATQVSHWLAGRDHHPHLSDLDTIATFFEKTITELVGPDAPADAEAVRTRYIEADLELQQMVRRLLGLSGEQRRPFRRAK